MTSASVLLAVVLDTNVWISGIFFRRGLPARILKAWRDGRFEVIVTQGTMAELKTKMHQKTVQFSAPPDLADEWLAYIDVYAQTVTATGNVSGVCRDPKDDQFLDAAVSGSASYLVSGDKDLLVLKTYGEVTIISPRAFSDLKCQSFRLQFPDVIGW